MKRILLIFIFLLILSSCKKNDDIYNVNKKISNMLSYTANAEIFIKSNKGISEYKVKQYYNEPNKLRIETIEPGFLKGKIMVFDGAKWRIYHPLINNTFQIEKLKDDDELIYLGVIQKNMIAWEDVEYKYTSKNGIEYVAIKCNIPGGNEYRRSAVLYMSRKEYYPEFMEILDDKEDIKITVKFYDFEFNSELEEDLFQLE
jgi:outer membrane lipoprotein-sorting protein